VLVDAISGTKILDSEECFRELHVEFLDQSVFRVPLGKHFSGSAIENRFPDLLLK
jgi:hypothetical protein